MSQDKNTDNKKPTVIRHSPRRVNIQRSYMPYDRTFRTHDPISLLRMMSQMHQTQPQPQPQPQPQQQEISRVESVISESHSTKSIELPIVKPHESSFAEFKRQYSAIKRIDKSEITLRPGVHLDLIHKKTRHLDTISDTLSEHTYHTTTNYSRLDTPPPQRYPMPENDDLRSVATQDMLLDDEEHKDTQLVLDTQQIIKLREKMELENEHVRLPSQAPEPSSLPPQVPKSSFLPLQARESSFLPPQAPDSSYHQKGFDYPEHDFNFEQQSEKIHPVQDERQENDYPEQDHNDNYPDPENNSLKNSYPKNSYPKNSYPEQEDNNSETVMSPQEPVYNDNHDRVFLNLGSDWGDDDLGDNGYDFEDETNNRVERQRIIPGTSFIPQPETNYKRPFGPRFIRDRFSNKLEFKTKLKSQVSHFDKVWDAYANQAGHDLRAYIEHRGDNMLQKQDIILLMKRQGKINDTRTLESLAKQYLPRECWDVICHSALHDNIIHPPIHNSVIPSRFDIEGEDDEEEEEEEETDDASTSVIHDIQFD